MYLKKNNSLGVQGVNRKGPNMYNTFINVYIYDVYNTRNIFAPVQRRGRRQTSRATGNDWRGGACHAVLQTLLIYNVCLYNSINFQVLGFEVDSINTVQFSTHTAYKHIKGTCLQNQEMEALMEGLELNGVDFFTHFLTGYSRSPDSLKQIASIIKKLRQKNPNLIYGEISWLSFFILDLRNYLTWADIFWLILYIKVNEN